MLIDIACRLTQDKKTEKEKEAIVDIDQLEISLDVPSEKTHCRRTKPLDVSMEDIRKVLDVSKENDQKDIKVIDLFFSQRIQQFCDKISLIKMLI